MSIISYAQNLEDVILWRALGNIERGFYIDVGANDPTIDSVTRAFYDKGWNGINIEPLQEEYDKLVAERPRDINLNCAAGEATGEIELWDCNIRGWATASPHVIAQHIANGYTGQYRRVPVCTLSDICKTHAGGDIHFLKIDVEGLEASVIQGIDFNIYRPWILVVEATEPDTPSENYSAWEDLLIRSNYKFVYSDGLNRFYLADEKFDLAHFFRYPPNVFDGYTRFAEVRLSQEQESLMQEIKNIEKQLSAATHTEDNLAEASALLRQFQVRTRLAEAELDRVRAALQQDSRSIQSIQPEEAPSGPQHQEENLYSEDVLLAKDAEIASLRQRLSDLFHSTSWRVTRPLRAVRRLLRKELSVPQLISQGLQSKILKLSNKGIRQAGRSLVSTEEGETEASTFAPNARPDDVGASEARPNSANHFFPDYSVEEAAARMSAGKAVAILAPVSPSGAVGGAERFYVGLSRALERYGCVVDLIEVPVDESSFENIQDAYLYFERLDLQKYDAVISTKAPSYNIFHSNHIIYLVHTVRVFYDMFSKEQAATNPALLQQQNWIQSRDTAAFRRARACFSIGNEVSKRLLEWNGMSSTVLHPPLDISGLRDDGIGDYFFMPGRLHSWKRVDLAIEALKQSRLPLRLIITGEGEAEADLRQLAAGDPRIEFTGRVSDSVLQSLYARALAIPFLPLREDYGYVTLEAFASGKPVITCTDSGEPSVLVEHGVNGFVCEPTPSSVAAAFESLWKDRELAEQLGQNGKLRNASITWRSVGRELLATAFDTQAQLPSHSASVLKVAVLDMQPITPPIGGGRLRLLGLYHSLGIKTQARYVGTYDWPGEKYRNQKISETLVEINVPLSNEHFQAASNAAHLAGGKTVIDMVFAGQAHLSPEFLAATLDNVSWADVVVFSHPWVAPLVPPEYLIGKTVVYDAQNVEGRLRRQLLNLNSEFERDIWQQVVAAEKLVGDRADLVLACSDEDAEGFIDDYGWDPDRIHVVPNGTFVRDQPPSSPRDRDAARKSLKLDENSSIGFFIGSDYGPNIEAAKFILEDVAPRLPHITFAIGGGVCARLPSASLPNVSVLGYMEESDKQMWLRAADFALNPMFSGSGTNIKMFDYMAAGLPVLTTAIGARGIASESTEGLLISDAASFAAEIDSLARESGEHRSKRGYQNRLLVEEKFAWERLSPQLGQLLRSHHIRKLSTASINSNASSVRIAHLSTLGLRCGIGEYTRKLVEVYEEKGFANLVLTGKTSTETPDIGSISPEAHVVWFQDTQRWRQSEIGSEALERLSEWGATHLIIQYHPGFYSASILTEFVRQAIENGMLVTIVVHNFVAESAPAMRFLSDMGAMLFSHRSTEVSMARELGVQLDLVRIGVDHADGQELDNTKIFRIVRNAPKLVTTGFLRRHKGIFNLIQAMPTILEAFPDAELWIYCALYSSTDSQEEYARCKAEIERLQLNRKVILDTRFMPKSEMYQILGHADLAILPYESSNEGGSAAATDCIAVGLPLIVSTAEIFDDLRDTALTSEPEPRALAHTILKVLTDESLYESLRSKTRSYRMNNTWEVTAGALVAHLP